MNGLMSGIVFALIVVIISPAASAQKNGKGTQEESGKQTAEAAAIEAALKWLSEHQLDDGGWNFDHRKSDCRGRCGQPGNASAARNAATAMALLPMLGAGETHKKGEYKKTVQAGLNYLVKHMKDAGNDQGSFHELGGSMYSHGLATMALCEAFYATGDMNLKEPAQKAIKFIAYAQDPAGGGWRYSPRQAGDTSVTGWQVTALSIARKAKLEVDEKTTSGAMKFLDAVQAEGGTFYGYTSPGRGQATTAVGLLCRRSLGWGDDNAAFLRGVEWLAARGPSIGDGRANLYYNYYATKVMHTCGGDQWDRWRDRLFDKLIDAQSKDGHMTGSWRMSGDHGADRGGRLYCTAMSALILQTE